LRKICFEIVGILIKINVYRNAWITEFVKLDQESIFLINAQILIK